MPATLIKKLAIHKFRGFNKTQLYEFKKVNLMGGANNIGKTVLLEALLLHSAPIA